MTIPEIIKETKDQTGLTWERMADGLGATRQTLHNWVNGSTRPDTDTLLKLAIDHDNDWRGRMALRCLDVIAPGLFALPDEA